MNNIDVNKNYDTNIQYKKPKKLTENKIFKYTKTKTKKPKTKKRTKK